MLLNKAFYSIEEFWNKGEIINTNDKCTASFIVCLLKVSTVSYIKFSIIGYIDIYIRIFQMKIYLFVFLFRV